MGFLGKATWEALVSRCTGYLGAKGSGHGGNSGEDSGGNSGGSAGGGPASGQGSGIGIVDQVTAVVWGDLTTTSEDQVKRNPHGFGGRCFITCIRGEQHW